MAERYLTSAIVSALIGSMAAFGACLIFFFFVYKPAQLVDANSSPPSVENPIATPAVEIPNLDINAADVSSVSINTTYAGYFEPTDRCAKTLNQYFESDEGFSSSSPCTIEMTFSREGRATRSIEIGRRDKATGEKKLIEKKESAAEITPEQFGSLAKEIVTNEAFRSWREGTMLDVSNCKIAVTHSAGTKTIMSNVDERTTVFLQMINAFKQFEKQLGWKTVQ